MELQKKLVSLCAALNRVGVKYRVRAKDKEDLLFLRGKKEYIEREHK